MDAEAPDAKAELIKEADRYLYPLFQGASEYYELPKSLFDVAMNSSNPGYIFEWYGVTRDDVGALRDVAPEVFVKSELTLKPQWKIDKINERKSALTLDYSELLDGQTEEVIRVKDSYETDPALSYPAALLYNGNLGFHIRGDETANELPGTDGDDLLTGFAGDDFLEGNSGDDVLDGGDGNDTGVFSGTQASYTLTLGGQLATLTDRREFGNGVDSLIDLEFLDFDENVLDGAFELSKFDRLAELSQAEIARVVELYIAYFNRAPDAMGLNFWGTAFANGMSLEEIASQFLDQEETAAIYSAQQTVLELATAVYDNVLGRMPDQQGLDFWVDQLESGAVGRDAFILEVLNGAKAEPPQDATQHFIEQQFADRDYLSDKTEVGVYFAVIKGLSEVDGARAAMGLFEGTSASMDAAFAEIDRIFTEAADAETGAFLMPLVGVIDDPSVA